MAHQPPPAGGYPPPGWGAGVGIGMMGAGAGVGVGGTANGTTSSGAPNGVHGANGSQNQNHLQQLPPNLPTSYDDPTQLFSVYPIGMYTPTARVAGHFAPHTEVVQPLNSSSELYPQYSASFQALDNPQTAQQRQKRADMAYELAKPLQSGSRYSNLPYASPSVAAQQSHYTSSSFLSVDSPSFNSYVQNRRQHYHPQLSQQQQQQPPPPPPQSQPQTQPPLQSPQLLNQQRSPLGYNPSSQLPSSLPPSFAQRTSSPRVAQQFPASSSAGQYQAPSSQPTAQQYRQPAASPSFSLQTQYRPPSQSQSPQVGYGQVPQSQSPVTQYQSPQLQRLPSPAQQTASVQQYQQPSPVQYSQPAKTSTPYQASQVSSSGQYQQPQVPQQLSPSSGGTAYASLEQQYAQTLQSAYQTAFQTGWSQTAQQSHPQQQQPAQDLGFPSFLQQPQQPAQYQQYSQTQYSQVQQQAPQPTVKSPPLSSSTQSMAQPQQFATQQQFSQPSRQQQQQQQQPQQHLPQQVPAQQTQAPPTTTEPPAPLPYAFLGTVSPPTDPFYLSGAYIPSYRTDDTFEAFIDRTLKITTSAPSSQPQTQAAPSPTTAPAPAVPAAPGPVATPTAVAAPSRTSLPSSQPPAFTPTPTSAPPQTFLPPSSFAPSSAPTPVPSSTHRFAPAPVATQQPSSHPPPQMGAAPSSMPAPVAQRAPKVPKAAKKVPESSPDPLALDSGRPSPAKKRKSNSSSRQSPALPHTPQKARPVVELKTLTPEERKSYTPIPVIAVPRSSTPDDEYYGDDNEWGDDHRTQNGDWDMNGSSKFLSPDYFDSVSVTPTSGRTGDKDTRTAFQKFQSLLEDISEESDSFPANPSLEEVSQSRFFDGLSADGVQPTLATATIDKLVRYMSRLQDNKKRQRSKANAEAIPWDVDSLLRLFKILDKMMRDAESIEPFPDSGRKAVVNPSPRRKKGGKKAASEPAEATPELDMTEEDQDKGDNALDFMKTAAAGAYCYLAILDCDTMPKQLYSEDLLSLAVSTIRNQTSKVIFPVVEGLAGQKLNSTFLAHIVNTEAAASARTKSSKKLMLFDNTALASLSQSTCGALPHIANLIARPDMSFSDSLLIQTVYLAVPPVFVREPATRKGRKIDGGAGPTWSVMKSIRTHALACLRGAFAKYEDQRTWIIEEILSSLGKNQEQGTGQSSFQLPDGQSISTLTALLLQLIQAMSHGVGNQIRRLRSTRMDMDQVESGTQTPDSEEIRLMTEVTNNVFTASKQINGYLVKKASGNKNTKAAQDTDFKAILDTVVSDLLQVLYRPEWPAAASFVSVLAKVLMAQLENKQTTSEANAAKSVALDYLGEIAARIRTLQLQMDAQPIVPSLDELIAKPDADGMAKLLESQRSVQGFLASAARDDSMYQDSGELARVTWAQELQAASSKASSVLERLSMETEEDEEDDREGLRRVIQSIRKAGQEVWTSNGGLFEVNAANRAEDATTAAYAIARTSPLQGAFDHILHSLITAMDFSGVALRSKALRGFTSIVVTDPSILSKPAVRAAIDERLSDTSPAVRDAAVDLIGKYVVQSSEWAEQYFEIIAARISDTGLSVRKRVVKLLRDMFSVAENKDLRISICRILTQFSQDEDDGIKDLALKSLSEILYPSSFVPDETAALLVEMLELKGFEQPLEHALEGISKMFGDAGHKDRFARTIDSLINSLSEGTSIESFDGLSYVRAISLLGIENPAVIDTNKASTLQHYLNAPPNNPNELAINNVIFPILTRSIPFLPKTSITFAERVIAAIRKIVTRPIGTDSLVQPIACLAAVTRHITKDYKCILGILAGTISKVPTASDASIPSLQYISALIAEYGKLDEAAQTDKYVQNGLKQIFRGRPLSEFLFEQYLKWSAVESTKSLKHPIQCLGALFRGYPQLILDPKADEWMNSIAESDNVHNKAYLLMLLNQFLESEVNRRAMSSSTSKDVNDLIGSATDMHESGISTALVQRRINFVIESAKAQHHTLQTAAMAVLTFTVKQGLYHPIKMMPLLVSLETSDNNRMANGARDLHAMLHLKHSSIVNCRYLDFARDSYDYQRSLTSEVTGQRMGKARLGRWWELLCDKRNIRLEFLKSLVRAFDFELAGHDSIDPAFVLYIAENLATLDYQNQEEVMLVIQHLSRLVSEGGSATANAIELGVVEGIGLLEGKTAVVSETEQFPATRLANATIVIALAMLTKNLLLDVYSLTEDKCLQFVSGRKSVVGDKPVTRRYNEPVPLDWSRLPMARGVETVDDYVAQRDTFLQLMKEDGSMGWIAA